MLTLTAFLKQLHRLSVISRPLSSVPFDVLYPSRVPMFDAWQALSAVISRPLCTAYRQLTSAGCLQGHAPSQPTFRIEYRQVKTPERLFRLYSMGEYSFDWCKINGEVIISVITLSRVKMFNVHVFHCYVLNYVPFIITTAVGRDERSVVIKNILRINTLRAILFLNKSLFVWHRTGTVRYLRWQTRGLCFDL